MRIRTKLLLSFLSLSMLIFIVGMIFYVQLNHLIEPLTPQSIPQSVDKLEKVIEKNDLIWRLLYRQLLVETNLEDYVLTNRLVSLQEYYMNEELLSQLIKNAEIVNFSLWEQLQKQLNISQHGQILILQQMQQGNQKKAKELLFNSQYSVATQMFRNVLNHFSYQSELASNESAVVTVKIAAKNITQILKTSLNTTLIIFFDAIVISLVLAFASARSISQPINLLRSEIERMGMENINVPITPKLLKLKGEIGDLARAYAALIVRLRNTTVLRDELLVEVEHRKQFEEELRETAMQLQESNLELDQFAYAASHDLRAPLRGIENLADWIKEDSYSILPDSSRKHLDLIKTRVHRLDALISGILEYSRAGKMLSNPEKVDLNQLLLEIIDDLSPPSHLKIMIDNTMPIIISDKAAITQVFLNLISNAIKFHDKPQGRINIGSSVTEIYYQFYVSDDGPGIDPKFHEKIFEIFQTLQSRDKIESTGIGLATVKKIIEKQGGKIWISSIVGQGSTFYFTWPKK